MESTAASRRYRFGIFEADLGTGELWRKGIRVKLNAQPFQVLAMLLDHPGVVLTREDIARGLWPDGTFVDYDHGVNSAINRVREALGDTASNPRFVETLARRGYRFVAPVERLQPPLDPPETEDSGTKPEMEEHLAESAPVSFGVLAHPDELPQTSHKHVRILFLLLQAMYLGFYIGALANLGEISDLLSTIVPRPFETLILLIVTAALLIPVRTFLLCAMIFRAPRLARKFTRIWPFLLVADEIWSLAPFLLLHHINFGIALSCTALLVYSPFAQRSLILMGAAEFQDRIV